MREPLYRIENLTFSYGKGFRLDIPELVIEPGKSVGFSGSNGSGKTTLLKILAFIEKPDTGKIVFRGVPVSSENRPAPGDVTMLLQEAYLLKRTVFDNVAYGLTIRNGRSDITRRVHEVLEWVGLPPERVAGRRWFELSGGEAQRVALASRLVLRPQVLILDEPTAGVDRQSSLLIKEAVERCRSSFGTSLIVASHDHSWLTSVVDCIKVLHEGRLSEYGIVNVIEGPWEKGRGGLYLKQISDGQMIWAEGPPHPDARAVLDPSDIIMASEHPKEIYGRSVLSARVRQLSEERFTGCIIVELSVDRLRLAARVTGPAAETLRLLPGRQVWATFDASSLRWH